MRVWTLIAATAVLFAGLAGTASAQNGAAAAANPQMPIAIVDVGHILKNHPTMKAEMEKIQADMTAADKAMSDKRNAILESMEQMRSQFTEGTPEYEREEKKIAERDTEFRLELVKQKKKFDEAQATVIYKAYTEINQVLKYASDNFGTKIVLRVNREEMDPKKPETIQMVMSQDVLYYSPNIDLTDWVLNSVTQMASRASGAVNR